jgi:uncharacterized phage-associated protein
MIRAIDVASRFLDLASDESRPLTQLQLLKLVYLAQGWHFALLNRPLFGEEIQAWAYGPVVQSVYQQTRKFGAGPISGKLPGRPGNIPHESDEIIRRVWNAYKSYSGAELTALTHQKGTPWHKAFLECGGNLPRFKKIENSEISAYFKQKAVSAA